MGEGDGALNANATATNSWGKYSGSTDSTITVAALRAMDTATNSGY